MPVLVREPLGRRDPGRDGLGHLPAGSAVASRRWRRHRCPVPSTSSTAEPPRSGTGSAPTPGTTSTSARPARSAGTPDLDRTRRDRGSPGGAPRASATSPTGRGVCARAATAWRLLTRVVRGHRHLPAASRSTLMATVAATSSGTARAPAATSSGSAMGRRPSRRATSGRQLVRRRAHRRHRWPTATTTGLVRPGSGAAYLWRSQGDGTFTSSRPSPSVPVARPFLLDSDGDDRAEIFWYGPGSAARRRVELGGRRVHQVAAYACPAYPPFVGDFDGNGRDDIFWYGPGTRPDSVWFHRAGGWLLVRGQVRSGRLPPCRSGASTATVRGRSSGTGPGSAPDSVWFGVPGGIFATQCRRGRTRPTNRVAINLDDSDRDSIVWDAPGSAPDFDAGSGRPTGRSRRASDTSRAPPAPDRGVQRRRAATACSGTRRDGQRRALVPLSRGRSAVSARSRGGVRAWCGRRSPARRPR